MKSAKLLLVTLLLSFSAHANADVQKLSWAPPPQSAPTEIFIDESKVSLVDITTLKFRDNEDVKIIFPRDKVLPMAGLMVVGGKNIRVIGGSLKATMPASQKLRAVLRFAGPAGSVFIEGLVIDADKQYGLDGIDVGSVMHKPGIIADVYVQNTLIENIDSTKKGFHADGFQYYGSTGYTRMDHVTIKSSYQGLFLDPQADIKGIELRNVDVDYTDPKNGNGYIFYLRHENNKRHPEVKLENVYAGERTNWGRWEEFSIYPPQSRKGGNVRKGNITSFPDFPEIKGHVKKGSPPDGSFVTEKTAGLNYQSLGYAND